MYNLNSVDLIKLKDKTEKLQKEGLEFESDKASEQNEFSCHDFRGTINSFILFYDKFKP